MRMMHDDTYPRSHWLASQRPVKEARMIRKEPYARAT